MPVLAFVSPMLWTTIRLLLTLRRNIALRALTRSGSALVGTGVAALFLVPAAFYAGTYVHHALSLSVSETENGSLLTGYLVLLQTIWVGLLLAPDGTGVTLGRTIPFSTLRPFPVRPLHIALASALGALLDLPTLLALPLLFALIRWSFGAGGVFAGMVALLVILLLICQTAALSFLLEALGTLVWRLNRRMLAGIVILALVGGMALGFGTSPSRAMASVFGATHETPVVATRRWERKSAPVLAPPPSSLPNLLRYTPAGYAANALVGAAQERGLAFLPPLLGLGVGLLLTLGLGGQALAAILRFSDSTPQTARYLSRLLPSRAYTPSARASQALWEMGTVAGAEWRALVRAPRRHLPLRGPATLLFTLFFAWMIPDMGADVLANLRDFAGMGALLYLVLWQIQLLGNRFGNEAGTATLLFTQPVCRLRLMMGRNLALGALLLGVDGAGLIGLSFIAQNPRLIPVLLGWLPAILLAATALGNLVSVSAPFPIARPGERFAREPERGLAFVYIALGGVVTLLLWPVKLLLAYPPLLPVALLYLLGLYVGSLALSRALLKRRERSMARLLDGKG